MRYCRRVIRNVRMVAIVLLASTSCSKQKEPPVRATPKPLEALPRALNADGGETALGDDVFRVTPLEPRGPPIPTDAIALTLNESMVTLDNAPVDWSKVKGRVMLVAYADTYLAQVAPTLARLDDAGAVILIRHPDAEIAFPIRLRDEPAFQKWLDEPEPGKFRVIYRADGFELQTNMGHVPGQDPSGPTVPLRGGQLDLLTLQKGIEKVQARFKSAPDYCVVASFGSELSSIARILAANYVSAEVSYFKETCLVYPRPSSH